MEMDQRFALAERYFPQGVILDLQGDLTAAAEETVMLHRDWPRGLPEGRTYLVVNFTAVPYTNSAGISILMRLVRWGEPGGYQSFGYGLSSHYQKLFRMVGLTEYMTIYPDERAVLDRIADLHR